MYYVGVRVIRASLEGLVEIISEFWASDALWPSQGVGLMVKSLRISGLDRLALLGLQVFRCLVTRFVVAITMIIIIMMGWKSHRDERLAKVANVQWCELELGSDRHAEYPLVLNHGDPVVQTLEQKTLSTSRPKKKIKNAHKGMR